MSILRTIAKGFPVVQLLRAGEGGGRAPDANIGRRVEDPNKKHNEVNLSKLFAKNAEKQQLQQQQLITEQITRNSTTAGKPENFSPTANSVAENKNIANPNQKGNDNLSAAPSDAQLQAILGAKGPDNQIKTGGSGSDSKRSITA
jgi:hypothetical protein